MAKLAFKGDLTVYYFNNAPQFALAKRCKGGVTTLSGWTTCRETLIGNVAQHAFLKKKSARMSRTRFEVMALLMINPKKSEAGQRAAINRYVKRSLRVINHFEKRAGWPLTRLIEVTPPKGKSNCMLFMFSASARWMRNSFLISTYLLMFRSGRSPHLTKWRGHKELMKKLSTYPGGQDSSAIKKTSDKWEILLKHRDKLNGDRLVKDNFDMRKIARTNNPNGVGIEGISRLCNGSTRDYLFLNRFAALCKKEGKHVPVSDAKKMKNIW